MYHKLACSIADICCERDWITQERHSWCVYAVERRINTGALCVILLVIAIVTQRLAHVFLFFGSVTTLRRRLGGWHAQDACVCQLISIVSVLVCVFVLGPCVERVSTPLILLSMSVTSFACFIVDPVYPKQLHFTDVDSKANNKRKMIILLLMVVSQVIGVIVGTKIIAVYCQLGMLMAFVSLVAEKHIQKKRIQVRNRI